MNKKIEEIKEKVKIILKYNCMTNDQRYRAELNLMPLFEELIASHERLESENDIVAKANEELHKKLDELQDKIERLEKENDMLDGKSEFKPCRVSCLKEKIKLQRVLSCAEEALTFYATTQNWEGNVVDIGVGNIQEPESSEIARDHGDIAREALADMGKK